ncbi:hypothetical protein D3C78_1509070 [compost metagenome]
MCRGIFQTGLGGAQGNGLLGHFDTLVGQIGKLVDLGRVLLVHVGLIGHVQIVAGFLGFQGRDLGRLRVGLQAAVVAAGLFEVGVRWCGAGRQGYGDSQQGRDHQLFTVHDFVLLVEWECVAPRRLLNGALTFLTHFLDAFLSVLH